jgi:hypothetical protein
MGPTDIAWVNIGRIKTKMPLDHVPAQPGLYRLIFAIWGNSYAYIGEARDIQRRISEYVHTPTQGNKMEQLIFDLLTEAGEAQLSICCDGLKSQNNRSNRETNAIAEARRKGLACLNRGKDDDVRMQQFRLESEERMLVNDLKRVRSKLAKL